MRVYIPATLAMLSQLVADGVMPARSGTAFAVTPTLREAYAHGDEDELGEIALQEAALASLRLLAGEESDLPPRRAVLVAEDSGFWDHDGIEFDAIRESFEASLAKALESSKYRGKR